MSKLITIRVHPSEVSVETVQGVSATVPLQSVSDSHDVCLGWAREIARICEKCSQRVDLREEELREALKALTDVGRRITRSIFNGGWATVESLLQQLPKTDIRILGRGDAWIPWELLHFDSGEPSLQSFCGFKRNIYRAHPNQGRKPEIASAPSIGFLAHHQMPLAKEEYGVLGRHFKAGRIAYREWHHLEGKEDLLAKIESLNIIHFAGLIAPVQYLEKSFILVDMDLWISPDDLASPGPPFSFTAGPLVVFNVRDNYARAPWHVLDYVELLLNKGAVGVIASEFPVPPILAEKFVERFYRCLFEDRKSIGQALADTKGYFLEECSNPFAMFYAPYFESMETPGCFEEGTVQTRCNHRELAELLNSHSTRADIALLLSELRVQHDRPEFQRYDDLEGTNKLEKIISILFVMGTFGEKVCLVCEAMKTIRKEDTALHREIERLCSYAG